MLKDKITIENGIIESINNIPVAFCYKESDKPLPVVFLLHGHSSCKDNQIPNAIKFAKEGFFTVLIDALYHGVRFESNFGVKDGRHYLTVFFSIIENTKNEIKQLITYLEDNPKADTNRVGITGFSMGGFTSFYTAICDDRIKAIAPICATPDWTKTSVNETHKETPKETLDFIEKYNPIKSYEKLARIPMLVQNGSADLTVPPQGSRLLKDLVTPLYNGRNDEFKFIEYPGYEHETAPDMIPNVFDWFHKYL